ncbi:MAG: GIY-YIG nuclease family protein [Sphingomonadaceae bacterium]|nr:GIY-YIG nuclease family protein [Sphingomonadaceae bacterium]MCP5394823.1 GIY-YIG nuclease family protein [Sphingomonadaceae bacterium]
MIAEPYCWVYIMASQKRGTLYIGLTSRLSQRIGEHREGAIDGFTKRYGIRRLVHLEPFEDIHEALAREKALKKWRRPWKIELIEEGNPEWRDLWFDLNR